MESKKDQLEIINLKADAIKKKAETEYSKADTKKITDRSNIEKAEELRYLLSSHVVDPDATVIGSEQVLQWAVQGSNRDIVMNKLIEVIKRF